jgi:hypothetical protein
MSIVKPPKNQSLYYFIEKILDYAGIFPPEKLALPNAFQNFNGYKKSEFSWVLSKFIITANKLNELTKLIKKSDALPELSLSVIGSSGNDISEFSKNFSNDLISIEQFYNQNFPNISMDSFEVKLPQSTFNNLDSDEILEIMISVSTGLEGTLGKNLPVFFEAPLSENYEQEIFLSAQSIAALSNNCGYKLRTGGVVKSAFPSAEVIAYAILSCLEFKIPIKFTAGLHHPFFHFNKQYNTDMHGFINVFAAAILAYQFELSEIEIINILTDQNSETFIFNNDFFQYKDYKLKNSKISSSRNEFALSFGSCSFIEPIDDLKNCGFLKS